MMCLYKFVVVVNDSSLQDLAILHIGDDRLCACVTVNVIIDTGSDIIRVQRLVHGAKGIGRGGSEGSSDLPFFGGKV